MAEDNNELEKRAVEELLKETDRARVRAETMGPAGWLKCPLQGTNKRFLLNTLRSSSLQRRSAEPRGGHSDTRGRLSSDSPDRSRHDRSRTPPRDHKGNGGHADHKRHHRDDCNNKDKKRDRERERTYRHKDNRERRHVRDGHSRNKDRHSLCD